MKRELKEIIGYIINGLSIALFIYLASILDVPGFLHPLKYLGWALLGLGIGLIVLSTVALISNRGKGLIESGVYSIVRHPMYVGAILVYLSYTFFHPHWLVLLLSLANVAIIYAFILQADQQNVAEFGDAYKRYMENVPRINLPAGIVRRLKKQ